MIELTTELIFALTIFFYVSLFRDILILTLLIVILWKVSKLFSSICRESQKLPQTGN